MTLAVAYINKILNNCPPTSGIFFVLPCIETYQKVDLRTITLDVPPQEVLTRDSVTVSVGKISFNVSISFTKIGFLADA